MEIEKSYKILDLEPGVSLEELRQAYRHLALIWHPDRYPQNSPRQIQAEAKFKEISDAYETLKTHLSHPIPAPITSDAPDPPPASGTPDAPDRPPAPDAPDAPSIPLGWLTGVFICYTLIAWILITLKIPFWVWIFSLIAWFTITLVASEDSDSSQPWLISLMFAGAIAGWVLGSQAGGVITATVWGMVGIGLGAIAGSETASKSVIGLLTLMGIAAIAGLIAPNSRGNWLGSFFGGGFGVIMGLMLGIILDAMFQSRAKLGTGSLFGLLLGGWIGAWMGAGQKAMLRVIERLQPEVIIAAWGVIALFGGVIAQMVAGEKLLASYNGFYTFLILGIISGLGLSFGWWLAY